MEINTGQIIFPKQKSPQRVAGFDFNLENSKLRS
jgi:hypothetical protein